MEVNQLIIFIILLGLLFDYTNGFHDAANVVSTVIATRVLAPLTAILLAGFFNTLGALHASGVAKTIMSGLVEPQASSQLMVLCALIGAILWNILTWYFGIPSSSSYALIGGLIGAAWVEGGSSIVIWLGVIFKVVIPMILSPLIGFSLSYLWMRGLYALKIRRGNPPLFRYLQMGSAGLVALSHGLNDAQKSMGIITLGLFSAQLIPTIHIPTWVILSCALMMGLGTASGGVRIIRTVGYKITKLEPIHGFAAEMSASCVILLASFFGMPISSTHMIVGSVAGVGAARGGQHVQWKTAQKLVVVWISTLPGAAIVSFSFYHLIKLIIN
jgi:inorganic phosphate transporter, PiT family